MLDDADTPTIETPTVGLMPSDILFEVIDGETRELPPMGVYEVWLASRFAFELETFSRSRGLGRALSEMLFDLRPHVERNRRPDVAFVSFDRWPRDQRVPRGGNAWEVVPDLAVEVVSPNDLAADLYAKVQEYLRSGVRLVWVVYPDPGHVLVFDAPTRIRVVTPGDELDGGEVLPGFRIPLARLLDDTGAAS